MTAKQNNGEHQKARKSTAGKRRQAGHNRRGDVNVFLSKKRGRKTEVWIEPTEDADNNE